jgi:hypothetical protein
LQALSRRKSTRVDVDGTVEDKKSSDGLKNNRKSAERVD